MLGFILISWFLSMWIANTAAAAMMIPIVTAVLEELKKNKKESGVDNKVRDLRTFRLSYRQENRSVDLDQKRMLKMMSFHWRNPMILPMKLPILMPNHSNRLHR